MRRSYVVCGFTLAALLVLQGFAFASSWPGDPAIVWPVSALGARGLDPVVASDGGGGAYVVWAQRIGVEDDVYAQHYLADGARAPGWPTSGIAVCNATGSQVRPVAAADGSGGLYVAWEDARTPAQGTNVYVQRLTFAGTVASGWAANGVLLSSAPGDERRLSIVADGAGGAYVTWERIYSWQADHDIFAGRVSPFGSAGFSGPVHNVGGMQIEPVAVADGAGGVILAWIDRVASRIVAQRLDLSGTLLWGSSHVAVRSAAATFMGPRIVSDGAGGAIVTWIEADNGYGGPQQAQRLAPSGALLWSTIGTGNAVAILSMLEPPTLYQTVADGAGGYYTAFVLQGATTPLPVRVSRHLPSGVSAPGWPAGGVELMPSAYVSFTAPAPPDVQPDGSGGVFVAASALNDFMSGTELRVGRVTSLGGSPPGWSSAIRVGIGSRLPADPALVALPGGSAFVAWETEDDANSSVVQANRVDRFGVLGNPAPTLVSVKDVAADQGGFVRVSWMASDLDADPNYWIGSYRLWRQVPVNAATAATRARARLARSLDDAALERGDVVAVPDAAGTIFWELVETQVAQALPGYSATVATSGDSTAAGNPRTTFMVSALHTYSGAFWNSAADSGYSVDNVAPPTPAPFTGAYAGGVMSLHWGPNPAPDFHAFRIYRGASPVFPLAAGTFVRETTDTGTVDVAGAPFGYALVAVDAHGNASAPAYLAIGTVLDVEASALAFALAPPWPNPARGACRIAFTVPTSTHVRLCVFDVQGRLVRTLIDRTHAAGPAEAAWDGTDDAGVRLAAGLFLVRFEAAGRASERRVVFVR